MVSMVSVVSSVSVVPLVLSFRFSWSSLSSSSLLVVPAASGFWLAKLGLWMSRLLLSVVSWNSWWPFTVRVSRRRPIHRLL
jgi:hypothetical protein